jgi:hypothetical protein
LKKVEESALINQQYHWKQPGLPTARNSKTHKRVG